MIDGWLSCLLTLSFMAWMAPQIMKPAVYIETSIIGYLASRPSRDLVTASNQALTRDWWQRDRNKYELFIALPVVDECSGGDPEAARERMVFLSDIPLLGVSIDAENLAAQFLTQIPLPAKAKVDALHLAVCTVHGIDYLLTWNCTHLANPSLQRRIIEICDSFGMWPPAICTPQQLLGDYRSLIEE
jgi:hypothetical protein